MPPNFNMIDEAGKAGGLPDEKDAVVAIIKPYRIAYQYFEEYEKIYQER